MEREQIIKAWEDEVALGKDIGLTRDFINYVSINLVNNTLSLIKELTEENERLRAENVDCRLGFTLLEDAFKKLEKINTQLEEEKTLLESQYETMYDTIEGNIRAEIAECENSCDWCEGKVKADTVRKMQERLKTEFKDWLGIPYIIDQIAKEMLKGNSTGSETCVVCGDSIPEGRQVCPKCEVTL